ARQAAVEGKRTCVNRSGRSRRRGAKGGEGREGMMKVKEIGFVAVPVNDIARARRFYEGILGLKKSRDAMEGKWIEYDLGGGTLALGLSDDDWKPSSTGTGYALEVEGFDQAIAELRRAGVNFVEGPAETAVCHTGIIQDPDGNRLGIHRLKAN